MTFQEFKNEMIAKVAESFDYTKTEAKAFLSDKDVILAAVYSLEWTINASFTALKERIKFK